MSIISIKNNAGDWEEMPALQGNPDDFVNLVYPVGSIYMSANDVSPSTLFGGSWEKIEDTFLLASGSTFTLGQTGGEINHTLTIDEMPANYIKTASADTSSDGYIGRGGYNSDGTFNVGGHTQPHNNMPPYLVVNIWKRIS